ncbi:MAG: hypothetical protein R3F60_29610 [bacterium]
MVLTTDGDVLGRVLENVLVATLRQPAEALALRLDAHDGELRVAVGGWSAGRGQPDWGEPTLAYCRQAVEALGGHLTQGLGPGEPAFAFALAIGPERLGA